MGDRVLRGSSSSSGFPKMGKTASLDEQGYTPATFRDEYWTYTGDYQRPADQDWLNKPPFGKISSDETNGRSNIFGYDLCFYIRRWLTDRRLTTLSLCEVILTQKEFKDLRKYVGRAGVFWSHLQSEPLLSASACSEGKPTTLSAMACYIMQSQESPFIWVDYLCLRQASGQAFELSCIIQGIHQMGSVVACVDEKMEYTKRSFCLAESFAAIVGRCKYETMLYVPVEVALERVNSEKAQCRQPEEKQVIDKFVTDTIGFERLDRVINTVLDLSKCCMTPDGVVRISRNLSSNNLSKMASLKGRISVSTITEDTHDSESDTIGKSNGQVSILIFDHPSDTPDAAVGPVDMLDDASLLTL